MNIKDAKELSNDELIKIVANMHDLIRDWGNGYGLEGDVSSALNNVGQACVEYCAENISWSIGHLKR